MRDRPVAAAAPAVPAPLVLGAALVVGAAALAPAISTRDVVATARPAFWNFPMRVGDYVGVPQVVDDEVQLALQASDHLLADFSNPVTGARVNFWVAYNEVQDMGSMLHSPKGCLPASGWEYERLERKAIDVAGAASARPFRVNEAIAVRGAERIALVYWMEARGRQLASEAWNKVYVFYDSMTRRRSDGALVRVVTSVEPDETDAQAFAGLG